MARQSDPLSSKKIKQSERELQALQLRKAGHTFAYIAKQTGYRHRSAARKAVKRALEQRLNETAETGAAFLTLQAQRLRELLAAHWDRAVEGDPKATLTVLKIMASQNAIMGLGRHEAIEEVWREPEDPAQSIEDFFLKVQENMNVGPWTDGET